MRRTLSIAVLCVLAAGFLAIGCQGKYADVKKVNREYSEVVQQYVDDLERTENAQDAAKAVNRFADGMEDLWPRMRALSEKYPELRDRKDLPEELKEMQAQSQEMGKKMGAAMTKLMPYMTDPEVQKAQKRLQGIMTGP